MEQEETSQNEMDLEFAGVNNENVNGDRMQPMEQNNEKPEVKNTDEIDNNDDDGPNDNNDNALGNRISDIEDEIDRDTEEFNDVAQTAPVKENKVKATGSQLPRSGVTAKEN